SFSSRAAALAAADDGDTLVGTGYAGIVYEGTAGNDTGPTAIVGTDDDEVFVASAGNDTIDGNGGTDTYSLVNNTTGGFVDLQSGTPVGGSQTGFDTLTDIENVEGGAGDDALLGDAGDNVFFASTGTDTVNGRDGSDTFDASSATADLDITIGGT